MRKTLSRSVTKRAIAALLGVGVVACVVSSDTVARRASRESLVGTSVASPFRAHLLDGSVIVYPRGATISDRFVTGPGERFDARRVTRSPASGNIALDSVVGFEVVERRVNPLRTLMYSSMSITASAVGAVVAGVVIFGSCPTIYGDSAGVETLQAESFSYSIAPLLAKRDVDRMTVQPDANGIIRLHVRNEALETHHLDHIEVVETLHDADELALPSPRGGAVAVAELDASTRIRDAVGRDVSRELRDHDALAFVSTSPSLDRAIGGGPTEDYLIVTVPRRGPSDSVALVIRARSSLLTTSVLYDHLIGNQGPAALDWMGRDLSRITTLARLGQWYGANFGMRVDVESDGAWRPVIRLMDFGPTAWRAIGLALPRTTGSGDSIRIRLTFPVDGFRIDQVAAAHRVRRPAQRLIPLHRVVDRDGSARGDLRDMLSSADGRDVQTFPGQQFTAEFDAGRSDRPRTFFFAGQGYYVEWVRPSWMRHGQARVFDPGPETMRELLRDWRGGRDSLEALFFRRRVPVL